MKILHLKSYKCLLSQNKRVKNSVFGYKRYYALPKHIKPFLKNIKVEGRKCPDYTVLKIKHPYFEWRVKIKFHYQMFCRD